MLTQPRAKLTGERIFFRWRVHDKFHRRKSPSTELQSSGAPGSGSGQTQAHRAAQGTTHLARLYFCILQCF